MGRKIKKVIMIAAFGMVTGGQMTRKRMGKTRKKMTRKMTGKT